MPNFMKIERGPDFFWLIWYGMTPSHFGWNTTMSSGMIAMNLRIDSVKGVQIPKDSTTSGMK